MNVIHKHPKAQSGFTLVELLLVMALSAMLLAVLTDMFVSIMNVRTESAANSAVSQDARYILTRLEYDMGRASAVSSPALLGQSGGTLSVTISAGAYSYALSGGNLRLTNSSGTNNLNSSATTVSNLTFHRLGNVAGKDTIRVTFTLTSKAMASQGQKAETFTTTIGRR